MSYSPHPTLHIPLCAPARDSPDQMHLYDPPIFGRWHTMEDFTDFVEVGRGMLSVVWSAKCLTTGAPYVVKKYNRCQLKNDTLKHNVHREISLLMSLRDIPSVCQLYGTFADDRGIYLVLEYCAGGDLLDVRNDFDGQLSEKLLVPLVLMPLLKCLAEIHRRSIMHRDVKPENIFVDAGGIIRLGDFGLALNWSEEEAVHRVGTLDYMAPEVLTRADGQSQHPTVSCSLHKRSYNSKVDTWAVGVLAYEMLTGTPPFEVDSQSSTCALILWTDPPVSGVWPRQLSLEAISFIKQALHKVPEDRPGAEELLRHPWVVKHCPELLWLPPLATATTKSHTGGGTVGRRSSELPAVAARGVAAVAAPHEAPVHAPSRCATPPSSSMPVVSVPVSIPPVRTTPSKSKPSGAKSLSNGVTSTTDGVNATPNGANSATHGVMSPPSLAKAPVFSPTPTHVPVASVQQKSPSTSSARPLRPSAAPHTSAPLGSPVCKSLSSSNVTPRPDPCAVRADDDISNGMSSAPVRVQRRSMTAIRPPTPSCHTSRPDLVIIVQKPARSLANAPHSQLPRKEHNHVRRDSFAEDCASEEAEYCAVVNPCSAKQGGAQERARQRVPPRLSTGLDSCDSFSSGCSSGHESFDLVRECSVQQLRTWVQ
eukprot:jgi/Mesvir1/18200/Mv09483-RA.2